MPAGLPTSTQSFDGLLRHAQRPAGRQCHHRHHRRVGRPRCPSPPPSSAAKAADYTVFVGGLDIYREGEGADRYNISLPQCQSTLLALLERASPASPLIAVILSGSSLDLSYLRDSRPHRRRRVGRLLGPGRVATPSPTSSLVASPLRADCLSPSTPTSYVNDVAMDDMQMRPGAHNPGQDVSSFYNGHAGVPVRVRAVVHVVCIPVGAVCASRVGANSGQHTSENE